ncbi:hypothetical protein SAMN05444392_101801 [Seinonella peptonophila]|uniref:Uncharacterized protein n=1 Tax=Seinonella peptonophila TaxID=112248 RepID=A0A1M4U438_9BACL|nr:hypothetical protein [Seinonella peptonophila]SHE51498.1 hypothetical protein SAMN05444392_101801 [Seinonella peptonophila]
MKYISLRFIKMEQLCPVLPLEVLSFQEMKNEQTLESVQMDQLPELIQDAIRMGKLAVERRPTLANLTDLINHLLKQKIQVRFLDRHPTDQHVRAQYQTGKHPCITIYRSSIQQMERFFRQQLAPVDPKELYMLHLFHEWFHHLEEVEIGRIDRKLAKQYRQRRFQRIVIPQVREIAAHAFTQQMMNLSWSPLLLDHLLSFQKQPHSSISLREHFHQLKDEFSKMAEVTSS